MFKKLLCLTLALALAVGLSACGKKISAAEAYQLYAQALDTVNNSVGLDLGVSTAITISQEGMGDYTTYNTSLQRQEKGGNKQLDALLTINWQGQSSENEYTIDGSKAFNISQQKYKEVELSLIETYTAHCQMYSIPEGAVAKVKTGRKNGVTSYTLTVDPAQAEELVKSHLHNYQMETESVQLDIKGVEIKLNQNKNGDIDEIILSYILTATFEDSGSTQDLSASTTYKIVSTGDGVSVNMPDFSALTPAGETGEE